ncbi:MAG TPA: amidase [Burkholderiales bacterium]|nr:amidase [Burkholderiales bacterium]
MRERWRLSLVDVARAMAEGRFNSEQLTRSCLSRLAQLEDKLHAWAWLDSERATTIARGAHAKVSRGPLNGIPIAVKDIFPVRGLPCEFGSALYAGYVPDQSAKVIKKIEDASAYVIGKTVTAEFAFLHPGKTRNPWNLGHTPGGSSSGSAAAVAAGFVPAAIGTQTNGSTIRPAAFCGIVGYKPSFELIPLAGVQPFSSTLDTAGVFTRSVADAALFASCLTEKNGVLSADLEVPTRPPRLAAVRSPVWHLAHPEQQQRFAADIRRLREAGTEVVEAELSDVFTDAHSTQRTIMFYEGAQTFRPLREKHRSGLSETLNRALDEGEEISEPRYRAALTLRAWLKKELDDFLQRFDAIITPPAAGEAPEGLQATGDPAFCTIWTLCGVPALTIPTGLGKRGLPLGLQIVGRFSRDDALLATAAWCEERLPFEELEARTQG